VSQGIRRVIISGGEPLVSSSILDIISHCAERGLRTSISTNGSLLTENYISLLKSAGLSKVTLSLDGPPEEHEDLRCHLGAYQKAIAAARMIYAEKMPFSVNCLVRSDLTTPSVKELFALTKAYHAEELTFTFPMLVGRMRRLSASWDKTWEEESKWLRDLSTFAETYRQITTAFVPKCGTETCSSKKLIFGKVPESSSLGGCVYLQYTAAELGADNEPKLVPTYNRSAATQILP
jgi:MoaA/NifB/PqqE/SkfB family radical SAM enzyme